MRYHRGLQGDETIPAIAIGTGAIRPGRRFGKYEILEHMATGGMAEIYLARASGIENFEKLCVIKRILPGTASDPEAIKMLLDEARSVATLHHSNIVQVFDIGQTDGEYFICMEYLDGRNVAALEAASAKRGERVTEENAIWIARGVCAGLNYAHQKTDDRGHPLGIVHRDVSPHNVIVTFDGEVKLLDFGLVKAEGRTTTSRSGTLKGKLAYMSPEQCRARPCDRRSDLFSLSIMLWELTTGQRLYTGECDYDFLCAILERDAPRPSTVIPDFPPELEAIIMRGLARDPDARWQTAEELQLALEEYARDRKLRVSPIALRRKMEELFADEIRARSSRHESVLGSGSIHSVRVGTAPSLPARIVGRMRRRLLLGLAAVIVLAALGITYAMTRASSASPSAAAVPPPPPTPSASTASSPSPSPLPTPSAPPPPVPPPSAPPPPVPTPSVATPTRPAAHAEKPRPVKPVASPPAPVDHDSLFPQ